MSTIRQIILFVLSLALALSLVKCKHEPEKQPDRPCLYDSSIEEMKKWYYFKEGTQWIYQEQTSGELDTATVYESFEGDSWFDYYVFHSNGDWIVHYSYGSSWSAPCQTAKECECLAIFRSRGKPGNFVGEARLFLYPNILDNWSGLYGEGIEYDQKSILTEIRDSIILGDSIYYDIIKWEASSDNTEAYDSTEYQVAKNIGIVRQKILETNKVWHLISHAIVQ
jgi:hypothetical protein